MNDLRAVSSNSPNSSALLPLRELIVKAEELGELEDTALKSFKKIMAANWKPVNDAQTKKVNA